MYYTGHGDLGFTTVIGGVPLAKCDPRLETLGALDEVHAHLGLARALLMGASWAPAIFRVQQAVHCLMADLATVAPSGASPLYFDEDALRQIEADLARWETGTGASGFVTPGNTIPGAHLHIARTIIRRAERQLVALRESGVPIDPLMLTFLNRLSSWMFALALQVEVPDEMINSVAA